MEYSRPKRQRAPPTQFVAGPASGRVADPMVEPGGLHAAKVPRTSKASAKTAKKSAERPRQKSQPTAVESSKLDVPAGFAANSMGSLDFKKSALSAGILMAAMSPSHSHFQQSGANRQVGDGNNADPQEAKPRGADAKPTQATSSEEPSRDGYQVNFKHNDKGAYKPDFTGAAFPQPPKLPPLDTNTAVASTNRRRFFEYLAYTDAIDQTANVEQEKMCFKCYAPTNAQPAGSDAGADSEAGVKPCTRVYDTQRRRYKCFHAECLAAMPADKRNSIVTSNDPWGVCDDEKCNESKMLLRCKTCPASFCSTHVPAYVIGLHAGIICGVCIQRLQSGGQDFQKGGIDDAGHPVSSSLASQPLSTDAARHAQSRPLDSSQDLGKRVEASPLTLSTELKRERETAVPQEAPGVGGAAQHVTERPRTQSESDNSNGAVDGSLSGSIDKTAAEDSGSDKRLAPGPSHQLGASAVCEQISVAPTGDAKLKAVAANSSKKRKGTPIVKGKIPVAPLGEIVWAQYLKYPYWPAAIPPRPGGNGQGHEKAGKTMVQFLDDMETGWVADDKIVPFLEGLDAFKDDLAEDFQQALQVALQATFVGGRIPKEFTSRDSTDSDSGTGSRSNTVYKRAARVRGAKGGPTSNSRQKPDNARGVMTMEQLANHPLFVDIESDEESEDEFQMTEEEYQSVMGPCLHATWRVPPLPITATVKTSDDVAVALRPGEVPQAAQTADTSPDSETGHQARDVRLPGDSATVALSGTGELSSSSAVIAAPTPAPAAKEEATREETTAGTAEGVTLDKEPLTGVAASVSSSNTSTVAAVRADTTAAASTSASAIAAVSSEPPLPTLAPASLTTEVPFELPRRMCCEMLSDQLQDRSPIGRRVAIYWPGDQAWYCGCVTDHRPQDTKFAVLYDDGKSEWTDLSRKVFMIEESMMGAAIDRMSNADLRNCVGTEEAKSGVWQRNTSLLREAREQDIRLFVLYGKTGGAEGIRPPPRVDYHDWRDRTLKMSRSGLGMPLYSPRYHEYLKAGVRRREARPKIVQRSSQQSSSSNISSTNGGCLAKFDSTCQKCFQPIVAGQHFVSWARTGGHQGQYYHVECRELPWPDSHKFAENQKHRPFASKQDRKGTSQARGYRAKNRSKRKRKAGERSGKSRRKAAESSRKKPERSAACVALREEYRKVMGRRPMGRYQNDETWLREMIAAGKDGRPATFRERKAAGVKTKRAPSTKAVKPHDKGATGGDEDTSSGSDTDSDSEVDTSESESDSDSGSESDSDSEQGSKSPAKRPRTSGAISRHMLPGIGKARKRSVVAPATARIAQKDPELATKIAELKRDYARVYGRRPMGRYQNDLAWLSDAIAAGGASQANPADRPHADKPRPAVENTEELPENKHAASSRSTTVPGDDPPSQPSAAKSPEKKGTLTEGASQVDTHAGAQALAPINSGDTIAMPATLSETQKAEETTAAS